MSLMLKLEKILNIENENRFGNCYKYAYYISFEKSKNELER